MTIECILAAFILGTIGCAHYDHPDFSVRVFESSPGSTLTHGTVYRIPTMTALNNGDVIFFSEERQNGYQDRAATEIAFRTLDMRTETLGPIRYVSLSNSYIWSDPSPIALNNGEILLIVNRRNLDTASIEQCQGIADNRTMLYRADQTDLNFTFEKELTNEWSQPGMIMKSSPSQGYQIGSVIYAPSYGLGPEADCGARTHLNDYSALYRSTNNGKDWQLVANAVDGTNESAISVTPNGVTMISRTYGVDGRTLTQNMDMEPITTLLPITDVIAHGGIAEIQGTLFAAIPIGPARTNLTLFDLNRAETRLIESGPSAYSNLINYQDGIGLQFEAGVKHPYEWVEFRFVNVRFGRL
jgi:hypothetical protein